MEEVDPLVNVRLLRKWLHVSLQRLRLFHVVCCMFPLAPFGL